MGISFCLESALWLVLNPLDRVPPFVLPRSYVFMGRLNCRPNRTAATGQLGYQPRSFAVIS